MKEPRETTKETSTNYRLTGKENGRKYPLMNARHYSARITKDVKLLLKVKVSTSNSNKL